MQSRGGVFLNNTNKKGLTLIELLAVIVILAIIALIATPIVTNIINDARKEAAKDSTYEYVKAIENKVALDNLDEEEYEDKEDYAYDEIKPDIKGTIPTGGIYSLKNGIITEGKFCVNNYLLNYKESKIKVEGTCTNETLRLDGSLKLSSNSGHYTYPEIGKIDIIENKGNGKLSCESSDTKVATCLVKGNTVTVKSGTKEGSTTLTITSAATSKYKEAKAAYLAYTSKGLLSITANGYDGIYDNKAHGITVSTGQNATVKYGEEEGTYDKDESPTYTDVGSYTVYYEVSLEGYNTIRGSKTVVITKADGEITLKEEKISIAYKDTKEINVTKNISGGNIKVEVLNKDIVEAEIKDNKIVITGKKLGTGKIKVISEATRNYKESSTEIEVTVVKANNTLKLSSTSGKYTYPESKTIEVEGNISGGLIKCVSADTKIANCTVNGNIITVKSGTKEGSTTLTITSEATENYNEQRLSYVAITAKGTLTSYTVAGYNGVYDSKEHGIVVTSSGSTITYSKDGTNYTNENPKYTDVGEYTVYYKIETEGYNDITGNAKVVITKAEGEMTSPTAKTLTYTESEQELINRGSSNTGIIEYKLDNGSYSESIPKATNPGTYKVYYRLVGDKNHKDIVESYITVTINKAVLSYTANGYTGVYNGESHGIVVTSKGTIKYGETEGTYDKDESPKYTDVGKYVVYFKITREGYYDITGSKTIEITKANNNIKLSSTSGKYTYPESGTFEVIENPSNEELFCTTEDSKIADCTVNGKIITVKPGTKEGSTTLTISTKGSKNYNAGQAAYVAITAKGTLRSYTVAGYNGVYNSKEHGIVVTSSGSTITYSKDGTNYTNENPKYTDVGEYIVYYKIETEGYNDITGNAKVVITKAEGTVVAPTSKTLTYTGTTQTLINAGSSSTGSIRYKLNDGSYSENLPQATNAGTYTVYYKVLGDSNHKDVAENSIKVTIEKAAGQVTAPTSKTLAYTGTSQTLINRGSSSTGTIEYKLDNGSYSTTLPKATNPGTYKVYYKVVGDSNHKDVAESSINVTIDKAVNLIKLSSNVGTYTYPKSGTFEVTSNPSGGALSCISSDTSVATCSVNGSKITVKPGTKEGNTTLTIKSAETTNYKSGQAAYVAKTEPGLPTITISGYTGVYDSKAHGIVVTSSEATIKYGTSESTHPFDSSPTYTDVGSYTVYYQAIGNAGYITTNGSAKVEITKANGQVTAPTAKTLTYTGTAQTLINAGSSSTGTIEYKLDNGSYSTSLPQATNAGTYKVYYKVVGDKNHFDVAENLVNVTIGKKADTITVTAKTYTYDGNAKTASFKTTSGLTPSVTYYSEASCTTTVSSPTNAGVYYARATTIGNSNYSAGSLSCTKAITINKAGNTLLLSSNSGTYTYPNSGTFTVTKNTSGGALSCTSSNTNVATCSVSGSTITVKPGTTKGTANITVTSASTTNYNSQTSTHVATTEEGLLSVTASGYEGKQDGEAHGIVVTSSGSTIKYGTSEGTYNLDSSPKYKNLGTYTVYYQVTKPGYKTITGSKQVIITAESVVAPSRTSTTSNSTSITAIYNSGSATSKIASTNCYITNASGTIISNGTTSGDNCVFNNLTSNTTYYYKKCITSKAENTSCSSISSILTAGRISNFDYTGGEQTYKTACNGTYKLETWGSSGWGMRTIGHMEYEGGFGGYSVGNIQLNYNKILYINVGGYGDEPCSTLYCKGGYNGGGRAAGSSHPVYSGPGGGATHIATVSGLLSSLSSKKDSVLIVAGGGGGVSFQSSNGITYSGSGGSGGGYVGVNGTSTQSSYRFGSGGSQTSGGASGGGTENGIIRGNSGSFGQGGDGNYYSSGGGGGFYGGGASNQSGSGGGSGYIGNPLLTDKAMYCYKCQSSSTPSTLTYSITEACSDAVSKCAKGWSGYAKITLVSCKN